MKIRGERIRGYYETTADYDDILEDMDTDDVLSHLATDRRFPELLADWIAENAEGGIEGFIKFLQERIA